MTSTPCPMCDRWQGDADLQIAELEHSYLILNRDQFFPGYCLLFTKQHQTELFHLDANVRQGLMEEISRVAQGLADCFQPNKLNYELLGNLVPHIHWHLVPRFRSEPLWPRPIWSEPHQELLLTADQYRERCEQIRRALAGNA